MDIGRIGNNQLTSNILSNLQGLLQRQNQLFREISSGKKILQASDDPLGTAQALSLQDQLSRNQQQQNVVISGNTWTNITNGALNDAQATWQRVSEIATSAADGTKSAADLTSMGLELDQLLNHLVQVSNTTNAGLYVFGGGKTNTPAFKSEVNPNTGKITGVFYQGDSTVRSVATQDTGKVPLNILGSNAGNPGAPGSFVDSSSGADAFKTMIQLRDKLLSNNTIGLSGSGGLLQQVTTIGNNLTASQSRLGGSQEVLDLDINRLISQNSNVMQSLSEVEDADTARLALELNNVQNVYQAALGSGGRILQLGLLNYI